MKGTGFHKSFKGLGITSNF